MRNKDDSTLLATGIFLASLLATIAVFVKKAIKAGRTFELLVSTPILVVVYWVIITVINNFSDYFNFIGIAVFCIVPLAIYLGYWAYLFSHEKITSQKACLYWANRDWWWTLDGWEFEEEVAKIFRLNGYKARVTKKTGDGGIDIILYKGKDKYIVQCKHYQNPLSIEPIRALNGIREDFGADKLIMIASSGLTSAGYEFLKNKPYYTALDLEDIIRMGLRPSEDEDIVDGEIIESNKSIPKIWD